MWSPLHSISKSQNLAILYSWGVGVGGDCNFQKLGGGIHHSPHKLLPLVGNKTMGSEMMVTGQFYCNPLYWLQEI